MMIAHGEIVQNISGSLHSVTESIISPMTFKTVLSFISPIVSFLISIPFAMYHEVKHEVGGAKLYCVPAWGGEEKDKLVTLIVIFTTYINPLAIIIVCYTQILRNLWTGNRHTYMPSIKTEVILLNVQQACCLVTFISFFFLYFFISLIYFYCRLIFIFYLFCSIYCRLMITYI